MRRTIGVAVAVSALVAGAASAAPSRDDLIRPGVGIAKARLGMTEAQVRKAMGRPLAVTRERGAFGRRIVELQYGYGSYNVQLTGTAGRERVVAVTTFMAAEKTPKGVGVGSLESQVQRAHPALRCEAFRTWHAGKYAFKGLKRLCYLGSRDDPQTVFYSTGPTEQVAGPAPAPDAPIQESWPREARVREVIVRAPAYEHADERRAREL